MAGSSIWDGYTAGDRGTMKKWRGTVKRKLILRGTKSEHRALVLVTPEGEYKLRRAGGNPFHDDALDELEGRQIHCSGELEGNELFLEEWEIEGNEH